MSIKQMLKKRKLITVIALAIIITGGYFVYQKLITGEEAVRYATAAVEKGTLIVSISGNGQVSASNQIDIKPKVSGDIVYVGVKNGQEVKVGALLVQINARDAQRAVRDAEIALESAKIKLEELLAGSDAQSLLQAENALAQAERDLEKAEKTYQNIETDAQDTLANAYKDGYSDVSTSFFKLSDYMKDLQDVFGTEKNEQAYISVYKIILGADSSLIKRLTDDYNQAEDLYNKNFTFFGEVFQDDNWNTIYKLINDTLKTTKTISRALESARHMFDAIMVSDYQHLDGASQIDKMQPKIESDISSVFSSIDSSQQTIDTIDNTIEDTPDKIKDAKLALESAKEKLEDKKLALEEIQAGTDPLDIRTQKNTVAQKEDALLDAKDKLADCFIRAPFDGIVTDITAKKGESISSGAVATLLTKQKMADITLNEIDAAKVKTGQKATITFDAIEELTISGNVVEVDTLGTVSQGVVTYSVKIAFDAQDERIKPGMSLSAAVITEAKQNALLVPISAVKQQENVSYVQTTDAAAAESNSATANISGALIPASSLRTQQVQVGLSNDTMIEVTDGLKEGDIVITQTITSSSQSESQQSTGFGAFGGSSGNREVRTIMPR